MNRIRRNTVENHYKVSSVRANMSDFRAQVRRHSGLKYVRRKNRRPQPVPILFLFIFIF